MCNLLFQYRVCSVLQGTQSSIKFQCISPKLHPISIAIWNLFLLRIYIIFMQRNPSSMKFMERSLIIIIIGQLWFHVITRRTLNMELFPLAWHRGTLRILFLYLFTVEFCYFAQKLWFSWELYVHKSCDIWNICKILTCFCCEHSVKYRLAFTLDSWKC